MGSLIVLTLAYKERAQTSILHMSSLHVTLIHIFISKYIRTSLTYLSAYLNTTPTYAYISIHEYVKIYEYLV